MHLPTLHQHELKARQVVVRVDMNVPLRNGRIADDQRIRASLPAIRTILDNGGAAIVLSHLGRPEEGRPQASLSLRPVAQRLQELLDHEVGFSEDYLDGLHVDPGEVLMCENVRFNRGEKADDPDLSQILAGLGDLFVMDAFACAHRPHASSHGAIVHAEQACAGPLMEHELSVLDAVMHDWQRAVTAIIGGAKISSKAQTLKALAAKVDHLVPVGGIANTFLASRGCSVGRSLFEPDWFDTARELCARAESGGASVHHPLDVVCAERIDADRGRLCHVDDIREHEMIVDLGSESLTRVHSCIADAGTVLWSGPVGVFENPAFANGTREIAKAVAASPAFRWPAAVIHWPPLPSLDWRRAFHIYQRAAAPFFILLKVVSCRRLPRLKTITTEHNNDRDNQRVFGQYPAHQDYCHLGAGHARSRGSARVAESRG